MRTYTTTHTVYSFDELPEDVKEKAIEKLWDLNVDHEWWQFTYEDAKQIGCEIQGFDIGRGSYCNLIFEDSPEEVANLILKNHGETCETYKTAKNFLKERDELVEKYSDGINKERVSEDNEYEFDNECDELEEEFKKSLSEDYRILLSNEYEYLTSEESIIETIKANEYEFDEDGELA